MGSFLIRRILILIDSRRWVVKGIKIFIALLLLFEAAAWDAAAEPVTFRGTEKGRAGEPLMRP